MTPQEIENELFLPDGPSVLAFAFGVLISIVGTTFNTIALICLIGSPIILRDQPSTQIVMNLILSDLLFSLVCLPTMWIAMYFRTDSVLGDLFCKINQFLFYWLFEVTSLAIALVSFNRSVYNLVQMFSQLITH